MINHCQRWHFPFEIKKSFNFIHTPYKLQLHIIQGVITSILFESSLSEKKEKEEKWGKWKKKAQEIKMGQIEKKVQERKKGKMKKKRPNKVEE